MTTVAVAATVHIRLVNKSLQRCSGWHSLASQLGSCTPHSLLEPKDPAQLAATDQAGVAAAVDGEEAMTTTATMTHHRHTTTLELAQTSRATAQHSNNSLGVRASGLAQRVELLLLGRLIVGASEATRRVTAAGGATEVEVRGITLVRVVQGLHLDHRASRAPGMRAQALARPHAGRRGWKDDSLWSRMIPLFYAFHTCSCSSELQADAIKS
jgi:hypothetical protein